MLQRELCRGGGLVSGCGVGRRRSCSKFGTAVAAAVVGGGDGVFGASAGTATLRPRQRRRRCGRRSRGRRRRGYTTLHQDYLAQFPRYLLSGPPTQVSSLKNGLQVACEAITSHVLPISACIAGIAVATDVSEDVILRNSERYRKYSGLYVLGHLL